MSTSPGTTSPIEIVEFTDPGCIWSWSSSPKLRWLHHHLAPRVAWRRVFGVGFGDMARRRAGFDPVGSIPEIVAGWSEVVAQTGAPLRVDPEWIFSSSTLMSSAAKAAERQGARVADAVLRRLREEVFVLGRGPDTRERLRSSLEGLEGLDVERLERDLDSAEVSAAMAADWSETRAPRPEVLALAGKPGGAREDGGHLRYSVPTLLVSGDERTLVVPGWQPLEAYLEAVVGLAPGLLDGLGTPLAAEEALEMFGTLTDAELEAFTGKRIPPAGAVALGTPSGSLWLRAEMARARGIGDLVGVPGT